MVLILNFGRTLVGWNPSYC